MELSRKYIVHTLGIPVPLNESIQFSKQLESRILHEQILYESFLDSIKNYAKDKFNTAVDTIKDWKDAAVVIGKVLSDGDLLNDFLNPLERRVNKLIQPLSDFLKKLKLDKFIDTIKNFIGKIKSLKGWKKFMALIATGSIITYVIEKLKSLAPDVVKDFLSKYFSGNFINDVLGKLTDWQSYLGWLQPIVKGGETVFNFLKPLTQAFTQAFKSGGKWATKLIRENKMDPITKYLNRISYKFPKGYPDMNNDQDVLLLETLVNNLLETNLSLKETALSPSELSKDATLPGGVKTPRIEILINKIENNEELELNDGTKFIVDNKEEVLSQLKGKTRISKAITLIDKDGNQITTSNLKKTAEFGGGGGMRGGADLTAKAESAQCIVNEIRYSLGPINVEDVTDEAIQSTKNKVNITDFEGAAELLRTNIGWLNSSVSIANELASQYPGPFIQNRGSDWVKNLEAAVKPKLKEVGISDINKWSPADIWMVSPDEMSITWPDTLNEINVLLLEKYNEGKIIGVSLKKAGKEASLKVFNDPTVETTRYEYKGIDPRPNAAKAYILFDDASIEFRNFGGLTGFMGEIIGKKAAGGKVGYSIVKKALNDNGIQLTPPKEIKNQVVENDPEFKAKFKKLWDSTEGLDSNDFEKNYTNPKKTPNQNLLYRVSKYLALEVVNAIANSNDPEEIVNDLISYAASSTADSAVFVKAS